MTKTLRILRTNGNYQEFSVEVAAHETVLDAVERIRSSQDRSLLYRHSCHHGSCGTCGAIVEGERVLMCLTRLVDCPDVLTVEPLTPFPVIGDLVVDPTPLFADFPQDAGYLRSSEVNPGSEPPDGVEQYSRFENCIECGLCESACPVQNRFIGPAALAAYNRELEKHPEKEASILEAVSGPHGAVRCERALECSRVCPLGVYPARHIAVLRRKLQGNA